MGWNQIPRPGRKRELSEADTKLVPIEESRKEANRLLKKYETELQLAEKVPYDKEISELPTDSAIKHFMNERPGVLHEFIGHGVNKGTREDKLAAFLNILSNRTIIGDTGPLTYNGMAVTAYTRSPFLLLSHYRQELVARGQDGRPKRNIVGEEVNVGAFVVNNDFYPIVDELREMFSGVNIIKANELASYISAEVQK